MSPSGSPSIYDVDLSSVRGCRPCLRDRSPTIEGAPARNQSAITASNIMQPNDDVGMKGQIGWPQRWWTMSQQECNSHATPMKRYDERPREATGVTTAG